jgi:ABC-2 type transport system permease protein
MVSNSISDGKIASYLIRPSNIWLQWYIKNLGWNLFVIFTEVVLTAAVLIIGFQYLILPSSIFTLISFVILSLMGYFCLVLTNFLFGFSAFYYPENWGIMELSSVVSQYLSGKTFPLNIIWFTLPLSFLPFAFNFYHPMQIYLGKYSPLETLYVFLGGIAWCVVLYFLAKWVFRKGLKRNESVGL